MVSTEPARVPPAGQAILIFACIGKTAFAAATYVTVARYLAETSLPTIFAGNTTVTVWLLALSGAGLIPNTGVMVLVFLRSLETRKSAKICPIKFTASVSSVESRSLCNPTGKREMIATRAKANNPRAITTSIRENPAIGGFARSVFHFRLEARGKKPGIWK